jgi:hypothetical protein
MEGTGPRDNPPVRGATLFPLFGLQRNGGSTPFFLVAILWECGTLVERILGPTFLGRDGLKEII